MAARKPSNLAGLPTSKTMFILMLQEMDGKHANATRRRGRNARRRRRKKTRRQKEEEERKQREEEAKHQRPRSRRQRQRQRGQQNRLRTPATQQPASRPQLYDAPPDEPKEPDDQETTENQATRLWDAWEGVSYRRVIWLWLQNSMKWKQSSSASSRKWRPTGNASSAVQLNREEGIT